MKKVTWAQLVALAFAEREEIRPTVHGYSVVVFNGIDYWAYTPEPIADPSPETTALIGRIDRELGAA